MKCPKCNYLGFETGDRCKNCGYDFSLIESSEPADVEVDLRLQLGAGETLETPAWLEQVDRGLAQVDVPPPQPAPGPEPVVRKPHAAAASQRVYETPLPLFSRSTAETRDEPLIKLPAAPRPPLAVRRTPDSRLRAVPKPLPRITPEPALVFVEEPIASVKAEARVISRAAPEILSDEGSAASARMTAAALDHALLLGIDLAVVYFTLRMAGLSNADWQTLPFAPLLAFLILLKLSYFCAFTAVGGQTIGKMAMRIRVVTDAGAAVDGACAVRRTLAGAISTLALGVGFIPALLGSDRRALHDRVAHTRVIALRSV